MHEPFPRLLACLVMYQAVSHPLPAREEDHDRMGEPSMAIEPDPAVPVDEDFGQAFDPLVESAQQPLPALEEGFVTEEGPQMFWESEEPELFSASAVQPVEGEGPEPEEVHSLSPEEIQAPAPAPQE